MFHSSEPIKFMMAKIFFTLADFRFQTMTETYPSHYHGVNTLEIHFIKKGSGKIIIDKNEYLVEDNSFFIVPPFVSHTQIPDKSNPIDKYSLYLLVDKTIGYKNYLPLLDLYFVGKDKNNICSLFDKMLDEFKNKHFGYNEIVVACLKSIIVNLLRDVNIQKEKITNWKLESMQFQIEEIILNEFQTITLNDLANRFYMSTREFQRYLKANYNKTFNELKKEARMSYASNKLLYSDMSIAEISNNCGYSSLEHFSYAFKEYYNVSPLKYKKNNKNK